jgi:hypothetical protein
LHINDENHCRMANFDARQNWHIRRWRATPLYGEFV